MLKKISTLIVLITVCSLGFIMPELAHSQTTGDANQAGKIKQDVVALKEGARVAITMRDKKKITAHVNYIGDDFFTVTEVKSQASHKLAYADVTHIERKNKGFPTWGKVALGVVGVAFVMGMIANGGE